jgi:hypothetical protein
MSSVVLASAIRGKSVLKGKWDVKEAGNLTGGNRVETEGKIIRGKMMQNCGFEILRFEIPKGAIVAGGQK